MQLYKLTTQKINELHDALNLTEDEEIVFQMLSKGKSRIQIADRLQLSVRSVDNRIKDIKNKIKDCEV